MSNFSLSKFEQSIVSSIASQKRELVETLFAWSSQNSGSQNVAGLQAMRALLKAYVTRLGGSVIDRQLASGQYVTPAGEKETVIYTPAIEVSVRPDAPIQLVLTGHFDTVFPTDSAFQLPKHLDDGTLNGPGTADMKGGILVMLTALEALEQSQHAAKVGYTVLLSPDEEIGSPGSSQRLMELGAAADVGLTFEPSLPDGRLAGARKGRGKWALIIRGKGKHAGREHHLGRNAISAMAEFVVALDALNGQRDGVTFNIAKIDGGGATNIVPELAIGRFEARMKEEGDEIWVMEHLARLTNMINFKEGISAELTGGLTRPPKPMSPANARVFDWVKQAGALLGTDIGWGASGGVCEGNNIWAAGCPNVDSLGVIGGEIHSDREYVKLDSLVTRAQLATVILLKIGLRAVRRSRRKSPCTTRTKLMLLARAALEACKYQFWRPLVDRIVLFIDLRRSAASIPSKVRLRSVQRSVSTHCRLRARHPTNLQSTWQFLVLTVLLHLWFPRGSTGSKASSVPQSSLPCSRN